VCGKGGAENRWSADRGPDRGPDRGLERSWPGSWPGTQLARGVGAIYVAKKTPLKIGSKKRKKIDKISAGVSNTAT